MKNKLLIFWRVHDLFSAQPQNFLILFFIFQGLDTLPCKEIGYILRTLGQNPTEDEILALVCEANCDWEGELSRNDFLSVAYARVQTQVNRLDDVKAAFR